MIRAPLARTLVCALVLALTPMGTSAQEPSSLYQASYDLEAVQNYAGALAQIEGLLAKGEDDYIVHLRHGWLLYLVGRYADAVQAYGLATERAPTSAEAHAGLALPLMALRRWSEAEAACRRVLKLAPGNYTGLSRLAYTLYSSGRYADAAAQYAVVLELYPSDVEMRTGLGWALLKQGKIDAARKVFQEVLRTAPSHVSATQGLAEAK